MPFALPTTSSSSGSCAGPVFAPGHAWRLMAAQVPRLGEADALLNGAVAIAALENDSATLERVGGRLDRVAKEVARRVRGPQPQALLAHLHEHLFEELGFCGDAIDYHNPVNSDVAQVLRRRTGLPITLSLIYHEVARRLGVPSEGVALPGHFVVRVCPVGDRPMLVDPFFEGVILSDEEAVERIEAVAGIDESDDPQHLAPVTPRHWLTRMIQNLLASHGHAGRWDRVAGLLELEMLLWPEQTHLRRDFSLCLARLGHVAEASSQLRRYLHAHPNDPQAADLRDLLASMR